MDKLSDPRRFRPGSSGHALLEPVAAILAATDLELRARRNALGAKLAALLRAGDDDGIEAAFAAMPDAPHVQALFDALAQSVESPAVDPQGVRLNLFALPLVLVAASAQPLCIPGALPAVDAVQQLFERSGVLGPMQNFGLSPALCALEALESLLPATIFKAIRMIDANALIASLPPADVEISPGREQAHLRFLIGAGIGRADAPELSETAANIGAWGNALSKRIREQLVAPGAQLLVLPRMPKGLMRAPQSGRGAQLDVALHLFVSNTVRRFRMTAGDPVAILSSHDDGELRLTLSSLLADDLVEGFRWPLARLDDLAAIQREMLQLLSEVRVDDVRVAPTLLPAKRTSGGVWHPRAAEWDALVSAAARH